MTKPHRNHHKLYDRDKKLLWDWLAENKDRLMGLPQKEQCAVINDSLQLNIPVSTAILRAAQIILGWDPQDFLPACRKKPVTPIEALLELVRELEAKVDVLKARVERLESTDALEVRKAC